MADPTLGFEIEPSGIARLEGLRIDHDSVRDKLCQTCPDNGKRAMSILRLSVFAPKDKSGIINVGVSAAQAELNLGIVRLDKGNSGDSSTPTLFRMQRAFAPEISSYIERNSLPMWNYDGCEAKYQFAGGFELVKTKEEALSWLRWVKLAEGYGYPKSYRYTAERVFKALRTITGQVDLPSSSSSSDDEGLH